MSGNIQSILFVPAKAKTLAKIASSEADAYIIDLEDSIADGEKDNALSLAVDYLKACEGQTCFVRVDRRYMEAQMAALRPLAFRGFMIPKTESCDFIDLYADHFARREIMALIETPLGMAKIDSIARHEKIAALAFGAEDYTAAANMQNTEENLLPLKSRIVMFAKAYGKCVYDTPSFNITNVACANAEALHSASLGFDGKLAIHPGLILGIKSAFGLHDMASVQRIVSAYESQGEPVMLFEGKVYEKMHIDRLKRILKENNH